MIKEKYPIITIVTPSFNQGEYIEDTIRSICTQGGDFYIDYIIIDGLSKDNTLEIIEKYHEAATRGKLIKKKKGVKFFSVNSLFTTKCRGISIRYLHEKDTGHGNALNKGFKMAIGEIYAWLNSDDMYFSDALQKVASIFIQFPQIEWLMGRAIILDKGGAIFREWKTYKNIFDYLIGDYEWIQQESTFWTAKLWKKAGGQINEKYKLMVDGELWTRFFINAELFFVDERLGGYRLHDSNRAVQQNNQVKKDMVKAIETMRLHIEKKTLELADEIKYSRFKLKGNKDAEKISYKVLSKINHNKYVARNINYLKYKQGFSMNKKTPLVTIVSSTFNILKAGREDFFHQSLKSIHNQTYPNIEHLIIDGGSNDGTVALLEKYREKGWIRYISEPDKGIYDAMNKGILKARGKYLAFINSDDFYHDRKGVAYSINALEESDATFSYAPVVNYREEDNFKETLYPDISNIFISIVPNHQTMFVMRSVMIEEGLYNLKYPNVAEYDLHIKLCLKKYKSVYINKTFVTYRLGGNSANATANGKALDEVINIYYDNYSKLVPITIAECRKMAGTLYYPQYENFPYKLAIALKDYEPYFSFERYVATLKSKHEESVALSTNQINQINQLNNSLAVITGSRGWRVLQMVRRIVNKIFPPGSLRRHFVSALIRKRL